MKKTLLALFALTLCVGAFAQTIPPTPPGDPRPAQKLTPTMGPGDITEADLKTITDLKAQLAQTTQAANGEISRLSVLSERNEYAYRLVMAQQENVALRNEVASARARAQELQTNLNDVQSRYDMEKAKVEALLKKHPGDAVAAQQAAKPAPTPDPTVAGAKK